MWGQELTVYCAKSSSPCITQCAEEYGLPESGEGFVEEMTFNPGFEASVGGGRQEGGWSSERASHACGLGGEK